MKRVLFLLLLVMLMASCSPGSSAVCDADGLICLEATQAIQLNQQTTISATVKAKESGDYVLELQTDDPEVMLGSTVFSLGHMDSGQEETVQTTLTIAQTGISRVVAILVAPSGEVYITALRINMTEAGGTPLAPGTSVPGGTEQPLEEGAASAPPFSQS